MAKAVCQDITQAALSRIEQGKTAVSADPVETRRKNFAVLDYKPVFVDFEKRLAEERSAVRCGKVARVRDSIDRRLENAWFCGVICAARVSICQP